MDANEGQDDLADVTEFVWCWWTTAKEAPLLRQAEFCDSGLIACLSCMDEYIN